MLTPRFFLLTATGLFTSFVAAAQSTTLSAANEDMLSWMLRVLLGAVCLVAVLAGIALTTASANTPSNRQQPAANTPTIPAAPLAQVTDLQVHPVQVTPELVAN
jgi:hypothetical protein